MGTDRVTDFEDRCPCGQGRLRVDFCTPDHAWPTGSQWYETHIECEPCADKYVIERHPDGFVLVTREEAVAAEKRKKDANEEHRRFMSSAAAVRVMERLVQLLDAEPSVAAKYRLAKSAGLAHETESTFRKNWTGAKSVVERRLILPSQVGKAAERLGIRDDELEKGLEAAADADRRATAAKPIGPPFHRPR